jgi:hypothetical protein
MKRYFAVGLLAVAGSVFVLAPADASAQQSRHHRRGNQCHRICKQELKQCRLGRKVCKRAFRECRRARA